MCFTIELTRVSEGFVTGRLIDTESGEGVFYEVTVRVSDTETAQRRVLKNLFSHIDWFTDLSEGGSK